MPKLPDPDHVLALSDGRRIGFDDRGEPSGTTVLFFHGTPDTRVARHPDDSLAAGRGLRVIAADRPGLGSSDADPSATPWSVADDHLALLDHVQVDAAHVVAWSAGSIPALTFAGVHPTRTTSLTLLAPLVPADAYDSPEVLVGADDSRRLFADIHRSMTADEVGRELAPWLVPPEVDDALAREILSATLDAVQDIPSAGESLVAALRGSVSQGMSGLEREIAAQATRLGAVLDHVAAPTVIHAGADDPVAPLAMSRWLADRLGATLRTYDAGHEIGITGWADVLAELTAA